MSEISAFQQGAAERGRQSQGVRGPQRGSAGLCENCFLRDGSVTHGGAHSTAVWKHTLGEGHEGRLYCTCRGWILARSYQY